MLDARLQAVADLVRQGSRMADIGTDHALLPAALVAGGRCPSAIASDLRKGPAMAAARTVEAAGLQQHIHIRIGNGLSTIEPEEVEDIVIAGMGGETIARILQEAPWTQNERYRFVLQPMTRAERLRRFLFENGYAIDQEVPISDGCHEYTVIGARYTGKPFSPSEALCHVGKLPLPRGRAYLEAVCRRLEHQFAATHDQNVAACLTEIRCYCNGEWQPWEER